MTTAPASFSKTIVVLKLADEYLYVLFMRNSLLFEQRFRFWPF
jgi:hypothetical protein